jgi:hypothetical protein
MGTRKTRNKRKRRKTLRGGDPEDVRRLLEDMNREVFIGNDDAGFHGRMETLLESDDFDEDDDVELDIVKERLENIASRLVGVLHHREATPVGTPLYTVQEIGELRSYILSNLIAMLSAVQRLPANKRQRLYTEIGNEIAFMNDTFTQLTSKFAQL